MHLLRASLDKTLRPECAWTARVQERVGFLLAQGRARLDGIDAAGWKSLKAEWRAFVDPFGASLRAIRGEPLAAEVLGETSHPGYRVQKIVFESFPGWRVGMDLFLPPGPGPHVAVLCPCGHGPKWQADHQVPAQVLARSGFAAALFDMPMFGEREKDNDHFIQGAQAAMAGTWSNWFFQVDAVRAADCLCAREDIDASRGLGVTGVSGGGAACLFLASFDDRVRALAPACSVASLGGHIVEGLYTGCPEALMPGQAAVGLDFDHLLCLAAPLPCLVIGGTSDTLFRKEYVERSVQQARRVYELEGAADRLSLFFDESPHAYTVPMANEAASWLRRWLLGLPSAAPVKDCELLPREALDCGTAASTDGMLQVIRREVRALRARRDQVARPAVTDQDIREVCRVRVPATGSEERVPSESWGFPGLVKRVLHAPGEPSLPVLDAPFPDAPGGTLACFVDNGKLSPLRQRGGFYGACRRIVSADIRGFGELRPEPSDYDMYWWCSVDRPLSDLIILCGGTALGEQVTDVLRVMDACSDGPIAVYGRAEAALPALFGGILHPRVERIILDSFPCSFESIATAATPAWSRYAYLPGVLSKFDIPELIRHRTDRRFLLLDPCGADGAPLGTTIALGSYVPIASHVEIRTATETTDPARILGDWLARTGVEQAGGR